MNIDATFWVAISFFIFVGLIFYFKIPEKVNSLLSESINNIKNQIDEAEKLKEEAKKKGIEGISSMKKADLIAALSK